MHVTDLPNYTYGRPGGPRHQCEPFRSLPDDLDVDVDHEAAVLAGELAAIVTRHSAVSLMGTEIADRTVFVRIGSDDLGALISCYADLRGLL